MSTTSSWTIPAPTGPIGWTPRTPPVTPTPTPAPTPPAAPKQWSAPPAMALKPRTSYDASIATSDGVIGVHLLPGAAPNAVNNFVFLANQGFYRNTPVHRMVPGFMLQGGDPTGTGRGGPGYDIQDDPVPAGFDYTTGTLAMANTGAPNSGGSQFFIMLGDTPLPKTYSIFGQVTTGRDVLAKINARRVVDNGQGERSKPVKPITIRDITITEAPAPAAG